MKTAALLVGFFTIVVGVLGLVSPDSVTTGSTAVLRDACRTIFGRRCSRCHGARGVSERPGLSWPKTLRALGAVMCMQALSATLLGPEHARAILEWETMHAALLSVGAVVAVAAGGFIVFAVATGRRRELVIRNLSN
jgi:hypothetical protein